MVRSVLIDTLRCANYATARLAVRNVDAARGYCSASVQRYRELMGWGLARRNPLDFLCVDMALEPPPSACCEIPILRREAGGTTPAEAVALASAARVLRPRRIFEIGTFVGKTTSLFILNAPDAEVLSLDLPEGASVARGDYIDTDVELVKQRRLGSIARQLGLADRYQQLLCDSMAFDPAPYADSVELGFIDGAHALPYVKNDTEKMAIMMSGRGLVFWHDYGGAGRFRGLSEYLHALARRIPIFRVPNTSLAWTSAAALRSVRA